MGLGTRSTESDSWSVTWQRELAWLVEDRGPLRSFTEFDGRPLRWTPHVRPAPPCHQMNRGDLHGVETTCHRLEGCQPAPRYAACQAWPPVRVVYDSNPPTSYHLRINRPNTARRVAGSRRRFA